MQEGFGIEPDARLALELFRHAASLGDPEGQVQMGMRYALGLQDQSSWDAGGIVAFGQVRWPSQGVVYAAAAHDQAPT